VLLKNGQGTLPLDPARLKSVALIGPEAGTASAGGAGSPKVAPIQSVSPLQAIGAEAHFSLPASSLAYWDTTTTQGWTTAPGTYQVYVGDSSAVAGLPLHGQFSIGGR
jgi:hypothetical protein